MFKSLAVLCVVVVAGCASLMSEEARKRMEERKRRSDEFVRLAQKYGYCGAVSSSASNLSDDDIEWVRKLFAYEVAPAEKDCQLCYDSDMVQNLPWEKYMRYNLIKWSNENLAKWDRGFKEQFSYQETFCPKSFMEFKFREEYSLGWKVEGHAPQKVSGEEAALILFTTQAMGLGNMGASGLEDLKRDTRRKVRIRRGTINLKRTFRGFEAADVTVDENGLIEWIEMKRAFPEGSVKTDLMEECKKIWKIIGAKYRILATRINGIGDDWTWRFENRFCSIHVDLMQSFTNPEISITVKIENAAINEFERERNERARKESVRPVRVKIDPAEGSDVL